MSDSLGMDMNWLFTNSEPAQFITNLSGAKVLALKGKHRYNEQNRNLLDAGESVGYDHPWIPTLQEC